MASKIKYRVNSEKAIESILLLSTLENNIDLYHIGKIIFYAEKQHINKYARPIIGDNHICGKDGPFPSKIRDLLQNRDVYLNSEDQENINKSVTISGDKYPQISPLREPDMDLFSESDIECLIEAFKKYSHLSFKELRKLTHNELCYNNSVRDEAIDYELLIDNDNENKDDILTEMSETAQYAVL